MSQCLSLTFSLVYSRTLHDFGKIYMYCVDNIHNIMENKLTIIIYLRNKDTQQMKISFLLNT